MSFSSIAQLVVGLENGNELALARAISIVENESAGYWDLLKSLQVKESRVIGITGAPGAGKSTLINAVISVLRAMDKKIGVIAVDPSSPVSSGSLLGDRIRMLGHYKESQVYIRSLSSRSALGGLSYKASEVCDVMKSFNFDYIFIETVGVGQSEVDISGLADETLLVLNPGMGDEIQSIKSGIIEVADIFVVNKCDKEGTNELIQILNRVFHGRESKPQIFKTESLTGQGIEELIARIVLAPQAVTFIRHFQKMKIRILSMISRFQQKELDFNEFDDKLKVQINDKSFNQYRFAESFIKKKG